MGYFYDSFANLLAFLIKEDQDYIISAFFMDFLDPE